MHVLKENIKENNILTGITTILIIFISFITLRLVDTIMQFGNIDPSVINFFTTDIITFQLLASIPTQMLFVLSYRLIMRKILKKEIVESYLFHLLLVSIIYGSLITYFRTQFYPNLDMFIPVFFWLLIMFVVINNTAIADKILLLTVVLLK